MSITTATPTLATTSVRLVFRGLTLELKQVSWKQGCTKLGGTRPFPKMSQTQTY